jgi:NTE family protein
MSKTRARKVGLVLGSGSARGWAHIGVLHALAAAGIRPDLICGTSIGALVGAIHAAGELDRLETWVRGMEVRDMLRFFDFSLGTGLLKGDRLTQYLRENFTDRPIEDMPMPFGAVATALGSGAEIWLREGSTVDAVRASIALPGIFMPVIQDGDLLVDGGLVNPVPVSLARAMGADIVIAVDLNSDVLGRHLPGRDETAEAAQPGDTQQSPGKFMQRLQASLANLLPSREESTEPAEPEIDMPSMFAVLASSLNIMQVRISRSRMAGDPPDVLITPRLAHLSLYDFHRGGEAIEEGRRAVAAALPQFSPFGLGLELESS